MKAKGPGSVPADKPKSAAKPLPRRGQFQPKTFSGPDLESATGKAGVTTPSALLPRRQRARV